MLICQVLFAKNLFSYTNNDSILNLPKLYPLNWFLLVTHKTLVLHLWYTDNKDLNKLCIFCICDQIWEKPPLTHKDKYLDIHNLIIQWIISPECMELLTRNSPPLYSYQWYFSLWTLQWVASWIACHFR